MGISEDHLARLNTTERPIVDQYREGKVKRTSNRGVKQTLKPCAYKRLERLRAGEVKHLRCVSRSESESEQGVQSVRADAKPSDLPLTRLKVP